MGWNLRNYQHKQKSPKEINCLQVNNKTITDIKDIANEFNIHFTTLLKKWKKINQSTIWIYTLPTTTKLRFILDPTTKEEVQSEIKTQKNNKFFGPSSIPTKVLKLLKTSLSEPISLLQTFILKQTLFLKLSNKQMKHYSRKMITLITTDPFHSSRS